MTKLAQIFALLHLRRQPLRCGIGRTIIDVNDLVSPATVERCGNLGDQRRHVLGLVAHRHNDGDIHGDRLGR